MVYSLLVFKHLSDTNIIFHLIIAKNKKAKFNTFVGCKNLSKLYYILYVF